MNLKTLSVVLPKKIVFISSDFPLLPIIIISELISTAFYIVLERKPRNLKYPISIIEL